MFESQTNMSISDFKRPQTEHNRIDYIAKIFVVGDNECAICGIFITSIFL